MDEKFFEKNKTIKQIVIGIMIYNSASIFGPLILIGGIGYFLDKIFHTKSLLLIISIFIAFIITNIFLFKKTKILMKQIATKNKIKS